jgi:uncharacterized protein
VITLLPLAAAALVLYLLSQPGRDGGPAAIGLDRLRPRADLALILPVFVVCYFIPEIGGAILLKSLGIHGSSPPLAKLPQYYDVAYVVTAIVAGIVEEIVVLGFLVRRLEQLGLRPVLIVLIAVAVRGSYHLYYSWDVLPILVWAALSVVLYRRFRRLWPFVLVHMLWDTGTLFYGRFTAVEFFILTPATIAFTALWWQQVPCKPEPNLGAHP